MCDKAVDNYPHVLRFVPDCYKTQEMCDKAVNRCFLAFIYIPDRYKTQQDPSMLVYCRDRYKTQRMYDEAVDDCLAALKFIPDWFVTSKMLENLDNALHANDDDILFYNEDFDEVTFIANQRHILAVDLYKIILDNDNNNNSFYEDDPDIVHVRLLTWCSKCKKRKALKKQISEELMPIARHPKRWWNFCMTEDEKKEKEPIFIV